MKIWVKNFQITGILVLTVILTMILFNSTAKAQNKPLKVILETDIGNDVDDAMALDMLYKYADEKKVELLGVSTNKNSIYSVKYIDIMNAWYGYSSVPIGTVVNGVNSEGDPANNYTKTVCEYKINNKLVFKSRIKDYNHVMESTRLYRKILSAQPDSSVIIISIGFSTNLSRLLNTQADEFSSLPGKELVAKKVKFLCMMAGNFNKVPALEYNVMKDIPAAQKVFNEWPTAIVVSPYAVGDSILFPGSVIENDFHWTASDPLVIGYESYMPMPYDRQTWDNTAVLYAVEKDKNYFTISKPGVITVDSAGYTNFTETADGNRFFLRVNEEQKKLILSRFIDLITTRPKYRAH
ncbi:MAG: nucleoside hydrolase [Ignavibacteriaceae bacterium]